MRIACALALAFVMSWQARLQSTASAAPGCRPAVQPLLTLPGRVDSLLAAPATGAVMALVGRPGSHVRYLPHDTLVVFHSGQPASPTSIIPLLPYLTAPGLAVTTDGRRLFVLADSTLLILDGLSGQVTTRQDLAMQAIGWPAAITTDPQGNVYFIGQPAGAFTDQANAFAPNRGGAMRSEWRTPLGITHAGTWAGLARGRTLAVFMPDQHDVHGTVALLDLSDGTVLRSYALPAPPVAGDAGLDRIYLADADAIRAFTLSDGMPAAAARGTTPLAVSSGMGFVAFVRDGNIVLADAGNLRSLRELPFPGGTPPTALAWQGSNLLVGTDHGITGIRLDGCT